MKKTAIMSILTAGIVLTAATGHGQEPTRLISFLVIPPEVIAQSTAESIRGLDAAKAAEKVNAAIQSVLNTSMDDAQKRQYLIAITAACVLESGANAATMMGNVVGTIPATWVPVVAATAVMASGDQSPAVTGAMQTALGENTETGAAMQSAASNPASVLNSGEMATINTMIQATQPAGPSGPAATAQEKPTVPTVPTVPGGDGFTPSFLQPAQPYLGQR